MRDDHTARRALYGNVQANAKFAYGLRPALLPDVPGTPQNTVIGGASLWVMAGKKPSEYKGVAQVLQLPLDARSAVGQPQAHRLPADHQRRYELTGEVGLLQAEPGTDVAVTQMIRKTTDKSRGIRLGNYVQIRTIIDEELEQVWSGKKSRRRRSTRIVTRGNEQLERFEKANKG
jgi:sn-glycerol 3-phosphate transport system substrate-binding protein